MIKQRLDKELYKRKLTSSRSQADSLIQLGKVLVNGSVASKSGQMVSEKDKISVSIKEQYVSRAGLKLASVSSRLGIDFNNKVVLDIGSSTGGFTDYALRHGAQKVIAVDVGTDQLHPSLRGNDRIELHEKTDIRDFYTEQSIDIIVGDVSFISLRDILPHVAKNLMNPKTVLVAMLKPQFEAGRSQTNKGVIKNSRIRRDILADFEAWAQQTFVIIDKRDSDVSGAKGNLERFYKLMLAK
ncbi:TlyA family RNA methyltransferase [Candidatus Saccharibacteria bacterium]|jgi:23S rRNA (cytidine1920-2'-O)/16S rRNA (cytidine1409-2'-O)-methyltransferase|nr:TlyA family RNA methyltransferase [Candidatus Saccharibacteria bacterium]